jgi:hypothetical protein
MKLSMLFTVCACAVTAGVSQPRLEVAGGDSFALGNIYRGMVVDRLLSLRNPGTDTLRLGPVDVSCGCTGTVVSSDRIAPGGNGTLRISFHSQNFAGPVTKTVTVHSNAEGGPELVIRFTATVIDEIGLSPLNLLFRDAAVKQLNVGTCTVSNNGTAPLALTGYRTQLKGLVLKLPAKPIPPGGSAEIRAEFTPESPATLISEGVFLTTSNPRRPELYIPVFGNAREFSFK